MKYFVALALAVGLTAGITGCKVTDQGVYRGTRYYKKVPSGLADLPVPRGFKVDAKRSWCYNKAFRTAEYVYHGKARCGKEVRRFYHDQMPLSDWSFQKDKGKNQLVFENNSELCVVRITEHGPKGTSVCILITPRDS